jgi:hypothetical protein
MNNEFWDEVNNLVKPVTPLELEYRLYYNESGAIIGASMCEHVEGSYVVVSQEEYERYFDYQVVNGRLKKIDRSTEYRVQLAKSAQGFPVVRGHAGLLIEDEEYTDREYYARTN